MVNATDFQPIAAALRAFPNPVQEELTVQVEGLSEVRSSQLVLRNALGQTVYRRALPPAQKQTLALDMKPYETGLYILSLESGNTVLQRQKVIK